MRCINTNLTNVFYYSTVRVDILPYYLLLQLHLKLNHLINIIINLFHYLYREIKIRNDLTL